jgi:hypothetical protein
MDMSFATSNIYPAEEIYSTGFYTGQRIAISQYRRLENVTAIACTVQEYHDNMGTEQQPYVNEAMVPFRLTDERLAGHRSGTHGWVPMGRVKLA